jgi:hypothetical protein
MALKSFYPQLPLVDKNSSTTVGITDSVHILLDIVDECLARAVFAIMLAESARSSDRQLFVSAGHYNYSGIQTDSGKWGYDKPIVGRFWKVDSGKVNREFAAFSGNEGFFDFMANRIRAKKFNGCDPDQWVTTYINSWWSPVDKAKYTKGTETYNNKLAIFNTAMNIFDKAKKTYKKGKYKLSDFQQATGATPSTQQQTQAQQAQQTQQGAAPTQQNEQESRRDEGGGSSNDKVNDSPNIVNIVEAKVKPSEIRFSLPPQKERKEEIISNFGKIPVIWYNSYQISPGDIKFLNLSTTDGYPTLKLTFIDSLNLMKDAAFPVDDTKVTLFINTLSTSLKPIHMDFKIISFTNNSKTYTINGVMDVSDLYVKNFKSIANKTSFMALKSIAEEIGMGYNSNIDDTDDAMTWINTGGRTSDFIEHITESSYKSDECYIISYIDYYYNLNFIELEKELNRDIKNELGVSNIGLEEIAKIPDKSRVEKMFLTNDNSMRASVSFFSDYRIINNSTGVSILEGYLTRLNFYDHLKKELLIFDVDSITSPGDKTIIMKGTPQDENFFNKNINLVYNGKLDADNAHKNYNYSYYQNIRNLVEFEKICIEITLPNPNYNLIRFQKVAIIISNQAGTPAATAINKRLSGEWVVLDISYKFTKKVYNQTVKLVKRELELSDEERKNENAGERANNRKNRRKNGSSDREATSNVQANDVSPTFDTVNPSNEDPLPSVFDIITTGEKLRPELEKDIDKLHPDVQDMFRNFLRELEKNGYKITFVSGHRGWRDSVRIWNTYPEVKICCKPGQDYHFFGMAMDLTIVKGNIVYNNNTSSKQNWLKSDIPEIAARHNMQWGIGFVGYYDPVHFALPLYTMSSLIEHSKKTTGEKDANRALEKQPGNRLPLLDSTGKPFKGLVKNQWFLSNTGKLTSNKN